MPAALTHTDIAVALTEYYRLLYPGVRATYDARRRIYVVKGKVLAQELILSRAHAQALAQVYLATRE